MPLKNKTFLSNICLYTFLILGGGCTDEQVWRTSEIQIAASLLPSV